jgi:phosphonate degradation associated HDIG domain protein
MKATVENIIHLFIANGSQMYGAEAVSQLEHALQCATLAEQAGKNNAPIAACLLHDLGHLIHNLGEDVAIRGIDDAHEQRAIPLLSQLFEPAVTEPIRLHVAAKRYLCASDRHYWERLSPASKRSLELQGGIFSSEEADAFIQQPYATDAVQLRIYDDRAKEVNLPTPDLTHFIPYLTALSK